VDELTDALAFERGLRTRAAQRTVELESGIVVLHDGLRKLHHLNALILDAPLTPTLDAPALARLADEHLGHLPHRHITINDGPAAERLAADFARRGWTMERTLLMALCRAPDRLPLAQVATEVEHEQVRELELEIDEQEERARGWPPGAAQLVGAGLEAMRAGTEAHCFAARHDGRLVSACTMFVHASAALLDNVGTLEPSRGRGLGRAVVAAAVDAALATHCHPILVAADADDWPRQLYARMGFGPLGTQVSFTLWAV
jgi:GNAT superfamily N-acetyltransferase